MGMCGMGGGQPAQHRPGALTTNDVAHGAALGHCKLQLVRFFRPQPHDCPDCYWKSAQITPPKVPAACAELAIARPPRCHPQTTTWRFDQVAAVCGPPQTGVTSLSCASCPLGRGNLPTSAWAQRRARLNLLDRCLLPQVPALPTIVKPGAVVDLQAAPDGGRAGRRRIRMRVRAAAAQPQRIDLRLGAAAGPVTEGAPIGIGAADAECGAACRAA